ncbi:P-loop containing nucleoside triphosphate hydrolase protein [Histomonas meleagridis]|uniref:P-loop containing nucleoside triphosphate hydrolase protein n=1 Tax=Histomonas meleagridis TaxID=135588 RepID=UPI00355ACAD0|nr:P-loop containing nucleoside triphosphate hydrolase protein [Histomonas meleagridis]KAH0796822.1 P-loop containing nucleoside triphosphate hydrolase protein [Histomonas meleagridis]
MQQLLISEFPEPKFLDEGKPGVDGNIYHTVAEVDDMTINVGDSVLLLSDGPFTYVCKVLSMFEDKDKKMLMKVNWYHRYEELDKSNSQYLLLRELLQTEATDIVPVDSVKAKAIIYDNPAQLGENANKKSEPLTNEFFCNRGFITPRNEFVALSTLHRLMQNADYTVETFEGNTPFDLARARLQLNFVKSVAGRENEIRKVKGYIEGFIKRDGLGGCLYLSGVPGTGKTLVVREVMRQLSSEQLHGKIGNFQFYELNCLRLESTRELFSELWLLLTDEKLGPTSAQKALNEMFTTETSPFYIILLVDEIDVLLTQQQNELYCLLEWASLPKAKFVVIAVANLMDLETRLKPKIASRMGHTSVKFFAYKANELSTIINSRVGDLKVFEPAAIQLCSQLLTRNGGDARKALEVCKRAIDMRKKNDQKVKTVDIKKAINQVDSVKANNILMNLSELQKLVLVAFLVQSKKVQKTQLSIRDIISRAAVIAKATEINDVRSNYLIMIINQLLEMNIINSGKNKIINTNTMISLITYESDLIQHLKNTEKFVKFLPK